MVPTYAPPPMNWQRIMSPIAILLGNELGQHGEAAANAKGRWFAPKDSGLISLKAIVTRRSRVPTLGAERSDGDYNRSSCMVLCLLSNKNRHSFRHLRAVTCKYKQSGELLRHAPGEPGGAQLRTLIGMVLGQ